MWRRIRIYGVGFILGLIACFFLFRDGCNEYNYLPEGRILAELSSHPLTPTERMSCLLKCQGVQQWDLEWLLKEGSVVMKESNPRTEPKDYVVEGTTNEGKKLKIRFQLIDDTTAPIAIMKPYSGTSCDCPDAP